MSSALRKTKLRLEEKGKKLTLEWTKMLVSVADDGAVAGESEWVGVSVRGDKNDVKRYSSEIRDLCKPLARTEADFMECVFAEFIATVADQALSGSAKKAKKDKAKKTPLKEPKSAKKSKASTSAPAAPAAAPSDAKRITMNALKKRVRGMLASLTKAGQKLSPEDLAAAGAKVAALANDLADDIDSGVKAFKEAKTARKKRKKKVPRFSPFLLFCKDARPKLQAKAKKDPSKALAIPDQAREMGRQWNKLSDAKKAPYVAEAAKLKAAEIERRANAPSDDEDSEIALADALGKKRKRKQKKKTPRFSAFLLFCKDVRPGIQARNARAPPGEKQAVPQQAKEMGAMWQTLEPSKKAAYVAKAEKLKAEYLASPEGIAAERAKESADEEGADDEDPAEPSEDGRARKKQKRAKRPRFSGFLLFCKEARPKLPEALKGKVTEQAREMGRMWKDLPAPKRDKLEAQAAKQKAAFLAGEAAEEAARRTASAAAGAPAPARPPAAAAAAAPVAAAPAAATPAPSSTGKRKRRTKAEMEAARAAEATAAAATAQTVAAVSPAAAAAKTPEKAKRHRRTKAEMEAARAAGTEPPAKKSAVKAARPASDSSDSDSDSDDTPLA